MPDARTSPANSNPVATTDVDRARSPTMMLLHARRLLTPMPITATRRAIRYAWSAPVTDRIVPSFTLARPSGRARSGEYGRATGAGAVSGSCRDVEVDAGELFGH